VGTVTFQVGANTGDTMTANFGDIEGTTGGTLNIANGFTWAIVAIQSATVHASDPSQANAISNLDAAISAVSTQAGTLGAVQNRLKYISDSINPTEQNLSASNSQIKDVNIASEMTSLTQQQVLEQAGTAMLAQANGQPQMILKLL
jgi:flagellin